MSFGAPLWFYALALLPLLAALFFWNEKRSRKLLQKIVAERLRDALAGNVSAGKRRARFFLLLAGLACVIASLAEPRYGYVWEQSKRKGRDIIIAIDTSKSMLSTDIAPNRLTRAKMAAQDLLGTLPGDRVGVIAFAGAAFLQAPLTIDYSAALSSINELDTDIIPRGGTDIAQAIKVAADTFGKGESENRCLILFTDGEELDESGVEGARKQADNFRIFTVGVGSTEGSIIPVPGDDGGTSFVKDENGQIVKSRLDENRLREIAEASGGFYIHLENGPATMKRILTEGFGEMKERDIDAKQSRRPIERYQWPLALGLALFGGSLLLNERKRASVRAPKPVAARKAVAAAIAILLLNGVAFSANSGVELYNNKNYQGAYDDFSNQLGRNPKSDALQFDAGTAAYQMREYDKALDSFSKAMTSRDPQLRANAEYNLANTLYERGALRQEKEPKLKEWRNAIQHYDEALKVDPKNESAEYNRDVVRKMIEELKKEPPKQQQQKQKQNQNQKQDQKDQQDQQNQQSKSDQGKDQKDSQNKQQQGSKGDEQKQKSPESKDQNDRQPQAKNEENKQYNSSQKQNSASQPKPDDEKNGGHQNQQQQGSNDSRDEQAQASPTPAGEPAPAGQKLSGEIKPQSSPGEKSDPQQTAEAVIPTEPGKMTEAQARALVESLKGEDERVQLEQKRATPVLKDW